MIAEAFSTMASLFLDGANPRDPNIRKILGVGQSTKAGVRIDHDSVISLPAVKLAVQIITDKMFGMPWYVFEEQEDGREYAMSHPSWKCITRMGNTESSAAAVRQQLTQWAMLHGNGIAAIYRPNWPSGPVEILPLCPDRTDLVRLTGLGGLSGDLYGPGELRYRTWIKDKPFYFARDEVIHIKGLGPNIYWGWSIFELMKEAIGGIAAKDDFTQRYFGQGAQPAGFIEMPGTLDEEAEENYISSLKQAMHGLGNAHKFVLLEEGAKFHETSFDPQKSQMLEARQFDIRTLAQIVGIKVHKLIDGANSAFASLEQANHEHIEDDIKPWINKWRVEYNDKLLLESQKDLMSHSIDIDDEALDYISYADKASGAVETYNNGLTTKDESRRKLNYGPSRSNRAKQFRIPANIVFEDDQAMVSTQPGRNNDNQNVQLTEARIAEMKAEAKSIALLKEVSEAYLKNILTRLQKQAEAKAAKSSKDFLGWVDSLATEAGPAAIQVEIDTLYSGFRDRINTLAEKATSEEELRALLCTST